MAIYVGNLSYKVTQEDLTEIFAEYGSVKRVQLMIDRETGRSRGFSFVEMNTDDEEEAAIAALDGAEWMGREMKVNKARPREDNRGDNRRRSAGSGDSWSNRGTGSYGRY
jgi:RNA recognition motif-containing protein